MSVFTLITFGFYIAMNALTPVFLQKPVKIGGYGFDTFQNACCKSLSLSGTRIIKLTYVQQSHLFTGSELVSL